MNLMAHTASKGLEMRSGLRVLVCGSIACLTMLGSIDGFTQERLVYKCTNAAGVVAFSDKECAAHAAQLNLKTQTDEDFFKQKAEHDAKVLHDKALAEQMQSSRLAEEQTARAAQDQQTQVNKALADKFEQERAQRNGAVVSSPNVMQSAPIQSAPGITVNY